MPLASHLAAGASLKGLPSPPASPSPCLLVERVCQAAAHPEALEGGSMLGAESRVQLSPSALDPPQPCPILQDQLSPLQPSLHSTLCAR